MGNREKISKMKILKNFALLTAYVNTLAQSSTVADIQSAYLTHTSSNTQSADTSLHGCNCKFLNDETFTPGPVYNGEIADWVCRGWRIARTCLLKQNTICAAQANTVYEFDGNCNTITGTDEVCHRALCNLDSHFAEELDNAVSDANWSAQQVYTDVDNPGQCALGARTSTTDRCCVSATGVYTYLQQNHASDFESKCTLPIYDSTETLIHSPSTTYTADSERGWNGNFPHKLASFEKDGIIFHCGGNYIQSFFANNGSVVDNYLNENGQSSASHCNSIWPFEYQGSQYFASANMANNKGAIYIYKLDNVDPTSPFKKFDMIYDMS